MKIKNNLKKQGVLLSLFLSISTVVSEKKKKEFTGYNSPVMSRNRKTNIIKNNKRKEINPMLKNHWFTRISTDMSLSLSTLPDKNMSGVLKSNVDGYTVYWSALIYDIFLNFQPSSEDILFNKPGLHSCKMGNLASNANSIYNTNTIKPKPYYAKLDVKGFDFFRKSILSEINMEQDHIQTGKIGDFYDVKMEVFNKTTYNNSFIGKTLRYCAFTNKNISLGGDVNTDIEKDMGAGVLSRSFKVGQELNNRNYNEDFSLGYTVKDKKENNCFQITLFQKLSEYMNGSRHSIKNAKGNFLRASAGTVSVAHKLDNNKSTFGLQMLINPQSKSVFKIEDNYLYEKQNKDSLQILPALFINYGDHKISLGLDAGYGSQWTNTKWMGDISLLLHNDIEKESKLSLSISLDKSLAKKEELVKLFSEWYEIGKDLQNKYKLFVQENKDGVAYQLRGDNHNFISIEEIEDNLRMYNCKDIVKKFASSILCIQVKYEFKLDSGYKVSLKITTPDLFFVERDKHTLSGSEDWNPLLRGFLSNLLDVGLKISQTLNALPKKDKNNQNTANVVMAL